MPEPGPQPRKSPLLSLSRLGVLLTTLALFEWFLLRPDHRLLAIFPLIGLPWIWRWQRLPLWWLLGLEVLVALVIQSIIWTCAFDACAKMSDAMHPWHFLPDMAGTIAVVGTASIVLAGLPTLATWARERNNLRFLPAGWRGPARWAIPVVAGALALLPVFFLATVFAPVGLIEFEIVGVLVALGVPMLLSGVVGFLLRTWVPSLVAIVGVAVMNVGAAEDCRQALECHLQYHDPVVYAWIQIPLAVVLVGAAFVGMRRRRARDGAPTAGSA